MTRPHASPTSHPFVWVHGWCGYDCTLHGKLFGAPLDFIADTIAQHLKDGTLVDTPTGLIPTGLKAP